MFSGARICLFSYNSLHTYSYDAHTGRLRRTWGPNLGGASYFDTSSYDPAGNRHTQAKYDYLSGTYSSSSAPVAVETQMNYYAADQELRVLDRTECYLPSLNLLNCDPPSATPGAVAGAYEEYRSDALGRRILVRTRRDPWCQNTLGCVSTIARTVWDGAQVLFEIRQRGDAAASPAALENDTAFAEAPYGPYGRVLYTHGAGLDHPLGIIRLGYSFGDGATTWAGPQDLVVHTDWRGVANAGHWTDGTMSRHCSALHPVLCVSIRYPGPSTLTFELPASAQPDTGWFGSLLTQLQDASGQLYKRNRYYDPSQGRFTKEDPLGLAGGLNLYGYANGDPVSYSDPFGLCPPKTMAEVFACTGQLLQPWQRPLEIAGVAVTSLPLAAEEGAVGLGLAGRAAAAGDAAEPAARVIGHYPAYLQVGEAIGAKMFNIPALIWNRLPGKLQWALNQRFLNKGIAEGAEFVMSTLRTEVRSGSDLEKEIQYLTVHGHRWAEDGRSLIPK